MNNILKFDDFLIVNEGKASDVEQAGSYISYHKEMFPGYNYPKRYIGKRKYKYRVLAREGDKVKPINFGNINKEVRPTNRLDKKYWDALPQYK